MARSVQGMRVVSEGRLAAGLPYLRLGQGAPLVMALGGTAEHANPASVERRISMSTAARFAGHFTVYVTSRKPGLAAGATMADVAAGRLAAVAAHRAAGAELADLGSQVLIHAGDHSPIRTGEVAVPP
jgi:hypothetical protein